MFVTRNVRVIFHNFFLLSIGSGGTVYCANSSSVTHEIPLDVSVEASGNVQLIMIRPLLSDEGGSL